MSKPTICNYSSQNPSTRTASPKTSWTGQIHLAYNRFYNLTTGTMATETFTMTLSERQRKPKDPKLPPENERFMRACSDIVSFLVADHEAQQDATTPRKDVNLNSLRAKMSKKHRLSNMPPLTAIIAAIPEHYKKYILPKLIAKPISESLPQTKLQF